MRREIIRGAAIGLVFTGISYIIVRFTGFGWRSLTVLMYLYVLMGVAMAFASSFELLESEIGTMIDRIVVVAEGEELRLRKLVSGEKYRVEGELEKL